MTRLSWEGQRWECGGGGDAFLVGEIVLGVGGDDVRLSPYEARDMSIIIITLVVYSRGF